MSEVNSTDWNAFLDQHPEAHLLQTSAWGELKSQFGWDVARVKVEKSGAQVLFRRLPLGFTIAYIPRGPVGVDWASLWPIIHSLSRARKAVFLKVEPDLLGEDKSASDNKLPEDFLSSAQPIQPPHTIVIDLQAKEAEILGRMKQKTRYNIRLAGKKGVLVHPSSDLDTFSRLIQVTGQRDGFGVHSFDYYRHAYQLFQPQGTCEIFLAEWEGEPLAALMVFIHGKRAWYLYGASNDQRRNLMPTYLLQWEAMRWAREKGCTQYDMWGVPDAEPETLEAEFTSRSDGLWGVYRFKRGFGGELKRTIGAFDFVYHPTLYRFYKLYLRIRAG
ncbi:MAG: peptidoglycan bridge formation glycyltransferase FemA/FemB family protein [Chloroflexi bacterium]|nr:peptidoglycan bridge formation glycyltransferase FemA/FemB family protein [Chloroflexota bacterium]